MVGVPTATMTTTISTHFSMALAARIAFVATRVLPGAGVPLLTVAMPSVYARPAYWPYVGHLLQAGPASARPIHEPVRQPISANSVRVYPGTYEVTSFETVMLVPSDNACLTGVICMPFRTAGRPESETTYTVRAEQDAVCGSLDAGIDVVGAVGGTLLLCLIGITSTLVGTARALESTHMEPLTELPLLAPLCNQCPTGITSTPLQGPLLAPRVVHDNPEKHRHTLTHEGHHVYGAAPNSH